MSAMLPDRSQLPGLQGCCAQIVDDLSRKISVFWLLPDPAPVDDLIEMIRANCYQRHLSVERVAIDPAAAEGRSAASVLAEKLDLGGDGTLFTPASLMNRHEWPDVLVIEGLTELSANMQARWCRFVEQWGQAVHGADPDWTTKALVVVVQGQLNGLPTRDTELAIHRLWAHLSRIDLLMLSKGQLDYSNGGPSWSDLILPELAGADLDLLEYLLSEHEKEGPELYRTLAVWGERLGWTRRRLEELQAQKAMDFGYIRRVRARQSPPIDLEGLWRIGALYWTSEFGAELHSSAAALIDRTDVLEHRIWRSQARTLLPVMDAVRREMCHYLTRTQGPIWTAWATAEHELELQVTASSPLAEFRFLQNVAASFPWGTPIRKYFYETTKELADIRNELAHYRPLSRTRYATLLRTLQEADRFR